MTHEELEGRSRYCSHQLHFYLPGYTPPRGARENGVEASSRRGQLCKERSRRECSRHKDKIISILYARDEGSWARREVTGSGMVFIVFLIN